MKPPFTGLLFATLLACPLGSVAEETKPPTNKETSSPKIEQLSESTFRLGGITFNKDTRKIAFDAAVNQDQDSIEYAIVHVTGKDHESLLNTEINPYHLQVALLLCGYKPDRGSLFIPPESSKRKEITPLPERDFLVNIEWKSPEGTPESTRIEDWILNLSIGETMPHSNWAFTGSAIIDGHFQADAEGSILAIYLDELAIANYPGKGNQNDEIWTPHAKKMPPINHPVRVSIAPFPQQPSKSQ